MGAFGATVATVVSYAINEYIAPLFFKEIRVCLKHELLALRNIIDLQFYAEVWDKGKKHFDLICLGIIVNSVYLGVLES